MTLIKTFGTCRMGSMGRLGSSYPSVFMHGNGNEMNINRFYSHRYIHTFFSFDACRSGAMGWALVANLARMTLWNSRTQNDMASGEKWF